MTSMYRRRVCRAAAGLIAALRARSDGERAVREKAYQKSDAEHWGVALPGMDAAIRETMSGLAQDETLKLCRLLWREPVWDLKIVAGRILARKSVQPDAKALGASRPERLALISTAGRSPTIWRASAPAAPSPTPVGWTRSKNGPKARACGRSVLRSVATLPWAKEKRDPSGCWVRWRATGRGSPMVHSKGDRLVAARLL